MRQAKVAARELDRIAYVRLAVAHPAGARVVRLLMATNADGVARHVQRPRVARFLNPRVALDAIDPLEHVRAVLERMRRRLAPDAQNAGAARDEKGDGHQPEKPGATAHRISRGAERRMSALASYLRRGLDDASTAAATSQPRRDLQESADSPQGQATPCPFG
jgi:hypothetical protein